MPTITDTIADSAKDLAYTAVGLNLLAFDQLKARLAERGFDLTEQVAIARDKATARRTEWRHRADETGDELQGRIRPVTEAVAPMRRTVEDTVARLAPARFAPVRAKAAGTVEAAQETVEAAVEAVTAPVHPAEATPTRRTPAKPRTNRPRKATTPAA